MFFLFTCGSHTFQSRLKGAEHLTVQCQNCGNFSGHVYKRWQWFTFCFVPVIPLSVKPWHEVGCHICNFYQDIRYRPDVQAQIGDPQHQQGAVPMQNYNGGGGGGGGGPPPGHMYK